MNGSVDVANNNNTNIDTCNTNTNNSNNTTNNSERNNRNLAGDRGHASSQPRKANRACLMQDCQDRVRLESLGNMRTSTFRGLPCMLYDTIMLDYTILYYIILYYTILYYIILYYTILCFIMLYSTMLYYVILCYTMLYYVKLC